MSNNLHNENLDDIPEPFKKFTKSQKVLHAEYPFIEASQVHMKKKHQESNLELVDILFYMLIFELLKNNNTVNKL